MKWEDVGGRAKALGKRSYLEVKQNHIMFDEESYLRELSGILDLLFHQQIVSTIRVGGFQVTK